MLIGIMIWLHANVILITMAMVKLVNLVRNIQPVKGSGLVFAMKATTKVVMQMICNALNAQDLSIFWHLRGLQNATVQEIVILCGQTELTMTGVTWNVTIVLLLGLLILLLRQKFITINQRFVCVLKTMLRAEIFLLSNVPHVFRVQIAATARTVAIVIGITIMSTLMGELLLVRHALLILGLIQTPIPAFVMTTTINRGRVQT